MKILIATDVTLRVLGNRVFAREKYATIFKRYYNAFGKIVFFSRIEKINSIVDDCIDISDITADFVKCTSLTKGLFGAYDHLLHKALKDCDLVICRCPSIFAYRAADSAKKLKKPFLAESMGCAWDAYWNHGLIGKAIAPYMYLKMRSVVRSADYASYVTSRFLQKRYPRKKESVSASNVLISEVDENIINKRIEHIQDMQHKNITLMTTAAVNVRYKGQQYVIPAIKKLNLMGFTVKYYVVGEGDNSYLKKIARDNGVEKNVFFKGRLPLTEVFSLLDECDIYIQPSLQEGLPRSVIEAMSRGCIVLGADTAGIPELLERDYVLKRKSVTSIIEAVVKLSHLSKDIWSDNAKRNFNESKKYQVKVLDCRRNEYYKKIMTDLRKEGKI